MIMGLLSDIAWIIVGALLYALVNWILRPMYASYKRNREKVLKEGTGQISEAGYQTLVGMLDKRADELNKKDAIHAIRAMFASNRIDETEFCTMLNQVLRTNKGLLEASVLQLESFTLPEIESVFNAYVNRVYKIDRTVLHLEAGKDTE